MHSKPSILITNDDGIYAEGLYHLWKAVKDFADVTVVAPTTQKSGAGLGITFNTPLFVDEIDWHGTKAWALSGTPTDCVRLSLGAILNKKPDLILSGINPGSNHGNVVWYSGTVGGVIEGALRGIPGIAFSCDDLINPKFDTYHHSILSIAKYLLQHPLPLGSFLNVNFPSSLIPIKGTRLTRQGKGYWIEDPEKRIHPEHGNPYFWQKLKWHHFDEHEESDVELLKQGYITATPIKIAELTDHDSFHMRKETFNSLFT